MKMRSAWRALIVASLSATAASPVIAAAEQGVADPARWPAVAAPAADPAVEARIVRLEGQVAGVAFEFGRVHGGHGRPARAADWPFSDI